MNNETTDTRRTDQDIYNDVIKANQKRMPKPMNHQTSETPETNKFRASLDGMREINQRDRMLSLARKLERERDEARKLFESSKRARASLSEACDHLQAERDTAQAVLATTRDVLCDALPGENAPTSELARMLRSERDEARKSRAEVVGKYQAAVKEMHEAGAQRDEARKTLEETRQGICDWEQTEDGQWLTDCGNVFEFTDGSPIYNDFICCPYCRKNLTETPYADDGDSNYTP